jgi:hypothetical protein
MSERCEYALCDREGFLYRHPHGIGDYWLETRFCESHAPVRAERLEWPEPKPKPVHDPDDLVTVVGEPTILTPPRDGTSLDAEDVFAIAEMYAKRYPGCTFVLDPEAGGEQLAQRIEKEIEGVEVVTFSQKTTPMAAASQRLAEDISARRIRYNPAVCEELTRHVLAAVAKFIGPMWRLVKPKGKKLPIDGAIALAMANETLATRPPPARSVWEDPRRGGTSR